MEYIVPTSNFDEESEDPKDPLNLVKKECRDRMKTALLSSMIDQESAAVAAIQQITLLRVYHQVTRVVQYLDLMDELEEKLYESIRYNVKTCDITEPNDLGMLLTMQERLQKSIIDSNKLLEQYMDLNEYPAFLAIGQKSPSTEGRDLISTDNRMALRDNAQSILEELKQMDELEVVSGEC